ALVILAVASAPWHFIIAAFLGGFGHGAALAGLQTAGIKRTTSDRVPIAPSTHYLALDSGLAFRTVMRRFIIHLAVYSVLYFAGAGIVALCLLVYWLGHGRNAARSGA